MYETLLPTLGILISKLWVFYSKQEVKCEEKPKS